MSCRTRPEYHALGWATKEGLLENEGLQDYLFSLWSDLVTGIETDLEDPDSQLREQMAELLSGLAEELELDEEMQAWVNAWLEELVVSVVDENRHSIASLISDTVRSWDAEDTSNRIEDGDWS